MSYLQDLFNRLPCGDKRVSAEKFSQFVKCFQLTMAFDPASLLNGKVNRSELAVLYRTVDRNTDSGENVSVAETAKALGVSVSFISKTLKSLEEKGLIERVSDKKDRRSVRVSVTGSGRQVVDQFFNSLFSLLDSATVDFTQSEIETMIDFFERFVSAAMGDKSSENAK